jgi:hypothetical protein
MSSGERLVSAAWALPCRACQTMIPSAAATATSAAMIAFVVAFKTVALPF